MDFSAATYPFPVCPLPYSYCALAPCIDSRTLHFHHDKHYKTYVENLNKALAPHPEYHTWTLSKLLKNIAELPEALRTPVRNNGGGVYNHELYFASMAPRCDGGGCPRGAILKALEESFGSYEKWKSEMKEAALGQFGSGWAYLTKAADGRLQIVKVANQEMPFPLTPLLPVDVWEHAYYLQYQNRRTDYVENWFSLIHWNEVNCRYLQEI